MSVVALVPAAGRGTRLGAAEPKAFLPLCGIPLVVRAVQGLLSSGVVDAVVVAAPVNRLSRARRLVGELATVVAGGADRADSVRAALNATVHRHPGAEIVLVHDAARALTPAALIKDVVAAARSGAAAVVPVLPLVDTVKRVGPTGLVVGTPDRSVLRVVQTPQAFAFEVLRRAYSVTDLPPEVRTAATDDAGLVEMLGEPVHTVPGHPLAFKITSRWDLELAERLIAR